MIIEGNQGADNATQRRLGFAGSVAEHKLDLLDSWLAHWETEEANQVFSAMPTANTDNQGVMAANEPMANGVVKALELAGRDDILVVGFDAIPAVLPMIEDGRMLASVDQFGQQMAANSIDLALEVVKGGPALDGWVKTPIELATGQ